MAVTASNVKIFCTALLILVPQPLNSSQVVHGCSEMLIGCYTQEQIDETKTGQLEMTKKVFRDILDDPSEPDSPKSTPWKYDVGECSAFKNSADAFRFKLADQNSQILVLKRKYLQLSQTIRIKAIYRIAKILAE